MLNNCPQDDLGVRVRVGLSLGLLVSAKVALPPVSFLS